MRKLLTLLIAGPLLVLAASTSWAQSDTSYIVVHALNPEGVEIASIEGMNPYSVQIYDGDNLIGHSAHDISTYNELLAISSGAHTIRVDFNGMVLEQNIVLEPGETRTLVFTFNRTEFDIASWINGLGIEGEVSLNGSAFLDTVVDHVGYREDKDLAGSRLIAWFSAGLLWPRPVENPYSEVSWDNTAEVKLTASSFYEHKHWVFTCSGNTNIRINTGALYFAWDEVDTMSNFVTPTSEFEVWYVQSIQAGYYPALSVRSPLGVGTLLGDHFPSGPPFDLYTCHGLSAGAVYTSFRLFRAWDFLEDWALGYDSIGVDFSEEYTREDTGSLIAKMSSVPYDLTGTGIGEEYQPPVVLVHGWNGSNSSWGNLKSLLEGEGSVVKYFSFESSNWNIPIETLADQLNNALIAWNDELQIDEFGVDIIAHSMGGLIARYYIAHDGFAFANKVKKLITLGTPHYGAAIAGWSDLLPFTIQGTQQKYASKFLWDLHQAWETGSIGTNVLCIAGARSYADPHDGFVRLPSASLQHLGYPVYYIPNPHTGQEGMAYILDENHPSFMAIKPFLSGETLPSNEPAINELNEHNLTDGFLIAGLFAPGGASVKIRNNFWGSPAVEWKPNPHLYQPPPINWWVNRDQEGDDYAGKYFATGADPGSYTIVIYPEKGYSPVSYPVTIDPRQTTVLSIPVAPAETFSAKTAPAGSSEPLIFEGTGLTMQFESGPGGEIEVYLFTGDAPDTDSLTLPYYWEVLSDLENGSFDAVITFEYSDEDLAGAGLSEDQLLIARYDSVWHPLATDIDTVVNVLQAHTSQFSLFGIGNFITIPDTSTISGYVVVDSAGLHGVAIDLYDGGGLMIATTSSDQFGSFEFTGVNNGNCVLTVASPIGYRADIETIELHLRGFPKTVSFLLLQQPTTKQCRGRGYWMHQVNALLSGRGNPHETYESMCAYMELIRTHFNQHGLNPVNVFEVALTDDCDQRLEALRAAISPKAKATMNEKARAHLTALLLNMVSGKIAQWHPISEDSLTVSQAITYCNSLITDGNPDNDEAAKDIAETINEGQVVPVGMIDPSTANIAYKQEDSEQLPTKFSLSQNYPNPFNPVTEISFALPSASDVKLEVFNIMGQRVAVLAEGRLEAGYHSVTWDGSQVASGVYFYRLDAGDFVESRKMVLLK